MDSTVTITYTRNRQNDANKTASAESPAICTFPCNILKQSFEDAAVFYTLLLFLVTYTLAIFTYRLWRASVNQGTISHKAFVEDKRAFIYPIDLMYISTIDGQGFHSWRFQPWIRNSGTTATKKLWTNLKLIIQDEPISANSYWDPIFNEFEEEPRAGFFPPQQNFFGDIAPREPLLGISAEQISACQKGDKFIYLIGQFIYYDRFPHTFQHVSGFCWEISMLSDPFTSAPPETIRFKWTQVPAGCYERDGEISSKWAI